MQKRLGTWDGASKAHTQNCDNCKAYRKIKGEELCGWGRAWKYLERTTSPRKCALTNKKQPEYNSIKYLDELIKNAIMV